MELASATRTYQGSDWMCTLKTRPLGPALFKSITKLSATGFEGIIAETLLPQLIY